ncbi:hypothetical protein [Crossiella cryophila]|uniref:IrrE N-terminal-like domain-containing protein n=1 Tax=Crossiella cryophila TaxID=43355 RepID=A0A7W7CE53_9PSEU|nr:hypothetical protein [Crossiella cryophila]MBB4679498.1 hypothetical protein [Crossiella cryophila]
MSTATKTHRASRRSLTPEEREERISVARQQLLDGVDKLMTAEGWHQLIAARKWLRRYSLNNLLMILEQCPGATDVRPHSEWKKLGYGYMLKGTHKIQIWKPVFRKPAPEETATPTAATTEEKPEQRKAVSGFMLVPVVDVSQLQGNPPAPAPVAQPRALSGDAPAGLWDGIAAQIRALGYTVERGDCGPANGRTNFTRRQVTVREDLACAQAAKTLTHELAHILCEHDTRPGVTRDLCEVEAESVACIVTAVCGLDSLSYSVPYVAHWATDRDTAHASAHRVLAVADRILERLDAPSANPEASDLADTEALDGDLQRPVREMAVV